MPRLVVIGFDCLSPKMVFEIFRQTLPNFWALSQSSLSGILKSTLPPISVPAWCSMVSGFDPGQLGIYGFHQKTNRQNLQRQLVTSLDWQKPPIWQILTQYGLRTKVMGVLGTYPALPLKGCLISGGFFAEPANPLNDWAYPPNLENEITKHFGRYIFDSPNHRQLSNAELQRTIWQMTKQRFAIAGDWLREDDWDFFMMVDTGADRLQHRFWPHKNQPAHEIGDDILYDYYRYLDECLGEILAILKGDDQVLVVSDHGAKSCLGAFALNDWLYQRGDLVLRSYPSQISSLLAENIDWQNTKAYAEGGYVGRIYLNYHGSQKATWTTDYLHRLRTDLDNLSDQSGQKVNVKTFAAPEIYREVLGLAPDLQVVVGDYEYRVIGSIGHNIFWCKTNDTGFDKANHCPDGLFIWHDGQGFRQALSDMDILDVAPTILNCFNLPLANDMFGKVIDK